MTKEELIRIIDSVETKDETKARFKEALRRSVEVPDKDREGNLVILEYLDSTLNSRINGIEGAGSWYENMTEEELLEKLVSPDTTLEEYTPEGAWKGCTYYKANIPGKNGIRFIDDLPKDSPLYLSILHRGTGRFSISTTASVPAKDEEETTIILGNQEGHGEIMLTMHPGDEVRPSDLTIDALLEKHPELKDLLEGKEGQEVILQITAEQAHGLGFDMAKLLAEAKKKEVEKNSIDARDIIKNEITLAEIRDGSRGNEIEGK